MRKIELAGRNGKKSGKSRQKHNIGIGIDIEDIERFANLRPGRDKRFLEKIYTAEELKYCFDKKNPARHLAVRYAAKEAVVKALCGAKKKCKLMYREIQISKNSLGAPTVTLAAAEKQQQNLQIKISLSHNEKTAIASCIILGLNT